MVKIAEFGSWESPLTAASVGVSGGEPKWVDTHGGRVWWAESRPAEGGRIALCHEGPDGHPIEVLPPPWNVRNRVHEYGGRPWTVVAGPDGELVVFTNWADQRLYVLPVGPSGTPAPTPTPVTDEPARPQGLRYTDLSPGPDGTVLCVRETVTGDGPTDVRRDLVAVPLDGGPTRVLAASHHFMTGPRLSPDGARIAWIGWDHPRMPWDGSVLCVARIDDPGTVEMLAGGPAESVCQVEWESPDTLLALSDPDGWWNLFRIGLDGSVRNLAPCAEELGGPLWTLGARWFAPLGDGRFAILRSNRLAILDETTSTVTDVDTELTWWSADLRVLDGAVVAAAGSPTRDVAVVRLALTDATTAGPSDSTAATGDPSVATGGPSADQADPSGANSADQGASARTDPAADSATDLAAAERVPPRDGSAPSAAGTAAATAAATAVATDAAAGAVAASGVAGPTTGVVTQLTAVRGDLPDPAYLPTPTERVFAGPDGRAVPALVYPPHNPDFAAPEGSTPPYVVHVHGGPTGRARTTLSLDFAYFTSRGIGVVAVNYGGSSGYGREFREALNGQWGVVDVQDCAAVAAALAAEGSADGDRLAVRGGSAGGWTSAASMTSVDTYRCGTIMFPILDMLAFVGETHDFESRYLDGLVGTLPEHEARYVERSPINRIDRLAGPVLLLQGLEDEVCPPAQADRFVASLDGTGVPHAYLTFEGEQHGFRKAETVRAALEAELSFYGQVFGFTPPGVPVLELRS